MECRLTNLGLPNDVFRMVRYPSTLSMQDLRRLDGVAQDYWSRHNALRYLIHLQGQSQIAVSGALLEAEVVARYRFLACSNFRAAWRRVPPEVWDIIFAYYLYASSRGGRTRRDCQIGERLAAVAPYTLSAVSLAWRDLVFSSPSVWTNVNISAVTRSTDYGEIPLVTGRWTNHILPRLNRLASHRTPWSLTLTISVAGKGAWAGHCLPLSTFAQSHESLDLVDKLKVNADIASSTYFGGIDKFPSASSVVIISQRRPKDSGPYHAPPDIPNATKVVLFNILVLSSLPHTIPWSKLTHLLVDQDFEDKDVVALLSLCTSIQRMCLCRTNFCLRPPGLQWFEAVLPLPSTLLHLTTLTVSSSGIGLRPLLPTYHLGGWEFPSLQTMHIFMRKTHPDENVVSFLRPFKWLTSLTLIMKARDDGRWIYHIGSVLDSCPLLVDLAIAMEFLGTLDGLVSYDWRPRARRLRRLAILCDPTPKANQVPECVRPFPVHHLYDLVACRRGKHSSSERLERLILRFMENVSYWGGSSSEYPYAQLKTDIEVTLRPFVLEGLELSVEIMMEKALFAAPSPNGKHWDDGLMDFVEDCWEYSTSMPRTF